jgi:hypothetical protein|tara:strand:- start:487 stop:855 length:369 start_codon:yes stop_codon:yes gene_type:complete
MPTLTITFTQEIQVSVQAHATDGDIILFCNPTTSGGFSSATQSDVVLLGTCLTIASNRLSMTVDYNTGTTLPTTSSFILFSKDKYSNPSGLLGYYAEVCFRNDSRTEAELFGINADIFESSK